MQEIFKKELVILPGNADVSGKLSYPDVFEIFMDMAAQHAQLLGLGYYAMAEKNRFWLTVKTVVEFYRRPKLAERVSVSTWLDTPGKIRCNRNYNILSGDELLIAGKTEWAVLNTEDSSMVPIAQVYPEGLHYDKPSALPGGFDRIADAFDDAETIEIYTVRSTDIDIGGHFNNAAYLRALFGALPNAFIQQQDILRVDAIFRHPAYEGERLVLKQKKTDEAILFRYSSGDQTVFLSKIVKKAINPERNIS